MEALATRVPSWGPRVNLKVIAPWEVPNWAAHVTYMGVVALYIRKAWIRDLTVSYDRLNMMLIHTAAKLVTRTFEEPTVVGGAAATFSVGGSTWTIGSELTQFDADAAAIAKAVEVMSAYYTHERAPPANIFLFSNNSSAIQAVKNLQSRKVHAYALHFHLALTTFYLTHADVALFLVWGPADDYLDRYKLASHITSEAAYGDPPNGLDRIQSVAFQKDRVCRLVFQKWEREYYLDRTIEVFRERWCDTPPSAAYSYTITTHPSETHHPLWKEALKTKVEEDNLGRKVTLPLYHRRTTSAAFQLAVDHAFMGTYAKRFRPLDPPETLLCTCGSVLRSPSHIITACPLHYQDRVNAGIHSFNSTLPLRSLFSTQEGVPKLLSFLQASRAAFCPLDPGPINLANKGTPEGVR